MALRTVHQGKQALRRYGLELWHRARLEWRLRDVQRQQPILVYQMGKVGSSTVVRTLEELNRPEPILQVHTLNPAHVQNAIAKQRASQSPRLPKHLITSAILVRKLEQGTFPCRIITLTREPVARAISFAFQDWQKKAPDARTSEGTLDVGRMREAVTELLKNYRGHADPTHWFDRELKEVFGVDVFSRPYNMEQGYTIFQKEKASVLMIRLEDLNRALPAALAEFLGVQRSEIVMRRSNEGEEKWYSDALQSLKEEYQLPVTLEQAVFETPYFRHFYSADRDQARKRWVESSDA